MIFLLPRNLCGFGNREINTKYFERLLLWRAPIALLMHHEEASGFELWKLERIINYRTIRSRWLCVKFCVLSLRENNLFQIDFMRCP